MNIHCISTAQTDLGLRSRTFSLKINKLPTFSEITQVLQCLSLQIMFLDTEPTMTKIKICATHQKITQL